MGKLMKKTGNMKTTLGNMKIFVLAMTAGLSMVSANAISHSVNQKSSFDNEYGVDIDKTLKELHLFINGSDTHARSGDTVGNGRVIEGDFNGDIDIEETIKDLFLTPSELEERNDKFQNLLDDMGIDPTQVRSGDTVGNGGGLLEAQASLAYLNLSKHIISSFEQNYISFSDLDREVLMKILNGLAKNPSPEKILFLSEEDHPGFFYEAGVDPAPRVAKTGFSLDFPIFINRDMVYKTPDMNSRFWIGLLIHEMGHQVGIRNHGYLDQLGARVVAVSEMNRTEMSFIMAPRTAVDVSLYNHDFIDGTPDLSVSHNGKLHSVTDWYNPNLRRTCGPYLQYSGVSISNLHWKNRGEFGPGTGMTIKAGAWAKIKCRDPRAGVFYNQATDVEIKLTIEDDKISSEINLAR